MEDGGPAGCDRVTTSRSGRAERSLISVDLPRKDRSITSLPPIQTPSTNKHDELLLIDTVDRGAIRRSFSLTCTRFQVKYLSQLFPKMLQYPTEPTNHPSPVCRKLLTAKECVDQCQPFGRLVEGHQVACTPDRHHAHAVVLHEPPGNLHSMIRSSFQAFQLSLTPADTFSAQEVQFSDEEVQFRPVCQGTRVATGS